MAETRNTGGFSNWRVPTESDKKFIKEALEGVNLVPVTPLYCAQQVVAGSNFLCIANDEAGNGYVIAFYAPIGSGESKIDVKEIYDTFKLFDLK